MSFKFLHDITKDEVTATRFLQQHNCLRQVAPRCSVCDRDMSLVRSGSKDDEVWRCPSHKAEKRSLRSGSLFFNSQLSSVKIVELLFCWSHQMQVSSSAELTNLNEKTVMRWFKEFRAICSQWLANNPPQIGGPGIIVEIDESLVAKQKFHVGRPPVQRWVFGGIAPSTGRAFLQLVDDRSSDTLLPLIQQYIRPGSIIQSDEWPSYNGIAMISGIDPPYQHQTVNHSKNFVDPQTGACTNHIESLWGKAKQKLKAMFGVQKSMLQGYLDEFLWFQIHGCTATNALENILLHISEVYSVT